MGLDYWPLADAEQLPRPRQPVEPRPKRLRTDVGVGVDVDVVAVAAVVVVVTAAAEPTRRSVAERPVLPLAAQLGWRIGLTRPRAWGMGHNESSTMLKEVRRAG